MSSLLAAREAYLTALRTLEKVDVSPHGGRFDRKELERYGKRAPAVVLTLLSFEPELGGGVVSAEAHWGVMVFTKHEPGEKQDSSCIALTEAVCQVLLPVFTGESFDTRPYDLDARNVYSTPLDLMGIAMWSIEWKQTLDLNVPVQVDDWYSLHATWDLQPRVDGAEIFEQPEATDFMPVALPETLVADENLAPVTDDSDEEYTV